MNAADTASRTHAVRRWATLFAILGLVLIGTVISAWWPRGGDVAYRPALSPPVLLIIAAVSIAVALTLLRRIVAVTADTGLRDPTTGLYRDSYVAETVANLIARDDRSGRSQLALVCIRVDYLDDIQRRYGRSGVGELLRCAGRQIRGQTRDGDLPLGTDCGFEIYLQCDELEQAEAFCRRLAMLLAGEQIELRGDVVKIATRMGAAMRERGESLATLQQRAVAALAQAKPATRAA